MVDGPGRAGPREKIGRAGPGFFGAMSDGPGRAEKIRPVLISIVVHFWGVVALSWPIRLWPSSCGLGKIFGCL